MAKKRKVVKRKIQVQIKPKEKEPGFMVRVNEPKLVRKDILESLREVILFMQSYEQFKQVQAEKVATLASLRASVKELNTLINSKLRVYFPKGKLNAMRGTQDIEMKEEEALTNIPGSYTPEPTASEPSVEGNEIDELEGQLRDIENQLKNIN